MGGECKGKGAEAGAADVFNWLRRKFLSSEQFTLCGESDLSDRRYGINGIKRAIGNGKVTGHASCDTKQQKKTRVFKTPLRLQARTHTHGGFQRTARLYTRRG